MTTGGKLHDHVKHAQSAPVLNAGKHAGDEQHLKLLLLRFGLCWRGGIGETDSCWGFSERLEVGQELKHGHFPVACCPEQGIERHGRVLLQQPCVFLRQPSKGLLEEHERLVGSEGEALRETWLADVGLKSAGLPVDPRDDLVEAARDVEHPAKASLEVVKRRHQSPIRAKQ